jgi:hypothetical protein
MADIIRALKDTPLPTLFVLIGFVMLSVGFGLKIKAVVDVDKINTTYAKVLGTIFLVFGMIPNMSSFFPNFKFTTSEITDPFLIYYLVAVPVVLGLYWAVLRFNSGKMQLRATKYSLLLVAGLVFFVALWRAMDVYFYLNASSHHLGNIPLGLYERSSYLPYFLLLGTGVLVNIWLIYANTQAPSNAENRSTILGYFVGFCIYLAVCRFVWEIIDYIARMKIPNPQSAL